MQTSILKHSIHFFSFTFLTFLLNSCQYNETRSMAKVNALSEKVLQYYSQHSDDSLKLKAARLLLENLNNHKTAFGKDLNAINDFSNRVAGQWKSGKINKDNLDGRLTEIENSLNIYNHIIGITYKPDTEYLTAEDIIENVDDAFFAWKNYSWSKQIKFEDFCEYILPHKVYNEPYEKSWRKKIMIEYKWLADTLKNKSSLREATVTINAFINKKIFYSPSMKVFPAILSLSNLSKSKVGKCEHLVTYTTYVLRALGIPAMIEICPVWGNNSSGHTWGAIKDENGQLFTFDALYNDSKIEELKETNVIPEGVLRNRKAPKIFRSTYSQNKGIIDSHSSDQDQRRIDVTQEYNFPIARFSINSKQRETYGTIYVAVYNTNEWRIAAEGKKNSETNYLFKDMGCDIVYLPVAKKNGEIKPIGPPFLLLENGKKMDIIPSLQKREDLSIDRKSNIDYDLQQALISVIGSKVEASNTSDFKNSKTLFVINRTPKPNFNVYNIETSDTYRYFRIKNPSQRCRLAELKMYGKLNGSNLTKELSGRWISSANKEGSDPSKVSDKNVLTYFVSEAEKNGFLGIDIGPKITAQLTKIEIYPPNDGNSVEIGDTYELLYWDDSWKSLEKKIALHETLTFSNCPDNALFKLKNLTKGYKERIFTYKNGRQVWW